MHHFRLHQDDSRQHRHVTAWTREDDERLLQLWLQPLTVTEISTIMGRTRNAVQSRSSRLAIPKKIPGGSGGERVELVDGFVPTRHTKLRSCMCCQSTFFSHGIGNRLCIPCGRGEGEERRDMRQAA